MRTLAILFLASACGEPVDAPTATTMVGLHGSRWEALSVREKATMLRRELVGLRTEHETRDRARALLQELRAVPLTDEAAATPALEHLRLEVRALVDGPGA